MRSLRECYEIAKKYHSYWPGKYRNTKYMCLAADIAYDRKELTSAEYTALTDDAMSLVESFNTDYSSLKEALSCVYRNDFTDQEVKAYWDNYIDSMENQDG